MFQPDSFVSMMDLARVTRVSHDAVRYWVRCGYLPPFDIQAGFLGRRWLGESLNKHRSVLFDKYLH